MNLRFVTPGEEGSRRRVVPHPAVDARRQEQLVRRLAVALEASIVQTPISWVLLARDHAWKIKKALRTPFLDYRTLDAREHFCREEVRLNRRLARDLYEGVEPVAGPASHPAFDGRQRPVEWAVRMRRFPDHALAGSRLAAGRLSTGDVDALARMLGAFHLQAPRAPREEGYGSPAQRLGAALAALEGVDGAAPQAEVRELATWIREEAGALAPVWTARREQGFVRECHGDLHLDNLLLLPEGPAAFDCIEFDPLLRFIDVVDDIAFPVMDLSAAARGDLAFRLLGGWLDATGDHDGLQGLRFAVVYRALVRAQVAVLAGRTGRPKARRYVDTARAWTRNGPPQLTIMHGLPGSGKTTVSQALLQQQGAIRIRSDVERKRLFGLPGLANSRAAQLDIYGSQAGERTYAELFARARVALRAGYPVILDATFLRRQDREAARRLACELHVQFVIASCEAPYAELERRVARRQGDASEADLHVLRHAHATAEPLAPAELAFAQRFGTA